MSNTNSRLVSDSDITVNTEDKKNTKVIKIFKVIKTIITIMSTIALLLIALLSFVIVFGMIWELARMHSLSRVKYGTPKSGSLFKNGVLDFMDDKAKFISQGVDGLIMDSYKYLKRVWNGDGISDKEVLIMLMEKYPDREIIPESVKRRVSENENAKGNKRIFVSFEYHQKEPEFVRTDVTDVIQGFNSGCVEICKGFHCADYCL